MRGFAVDASELQRCDAQLSAAAAQARHALARTRSHGEAVFATGWQGTAASAFRLGWEQWLDGAADLVSALEEMSAALGASGAEYARTDDAVRADVARTSA